MVECLLIMHVELASLNLIRCMLWRYAPVILVFRKQRQEGRKSGSSLATK